MLTYHWCLQAFLQCGHSPTQCGSAGSEHILTKNQHHAFSYLQKFCLPGYGLLLLSYVLHACFHLVMPQDFRTKKVSFHEVHFLECCSEEEYCLGQLAPKPV